LNYGILQDFSGTKQGHNQIVVKGNSMPEMD